MKAPLSAIEWHPGPGAEELVRRKAELLVLSRQLLERERGLAAFRGELHAFETSYRKALGARYARLDRLFLDTSYSVDAHFVDSGGIFTGAEVTYRGVRVGQVSAMHLTRDGVDVVMAIETSAIPAIHLPDPYAVTESLYGYLEARGAVPVRALQHIRAVNASAEQARLAGIEEGRAMLHITRVSYLENGAPVELTHSFCRSDYYEFVAESRR